MHILQPKHSKLNKEEVAKLLKEFCISFSQLPKIKLEDSAIADLKAANGDVIKIERKEEDKEVIYYRVVI